MSGVTHVVTGDGCRIAYRLEGEAGRPVLLLSNSLGTDMSMWDAQIPDLLGHFRVLRYDPRGHGTSDVPPGSYAMDRLGRDVVELLDHLGLDRVSFCGLSMGGMVGQWLCLRAPERLDRVVLANTSAYMGPPAGWDARVQQVLRDGMISIAAAVLERWFTPGFLLSADLPVGRLREVLVATSPVGYAGCCAAIRDMDMRPFVRIIDRPVLVIGGEHDPATPPEHADTLASGIKNARRVLLPTAHLANVELPEVFTAHVIDFLHGTVPSRD
jgi:3-oxoadipate enol-lactonase